MCDLHGNSLVWNRRKFVVFERDRTQIDFKRLVGRILFENAEIYTDMTVFGYRIYEFSRFGIRERLRFRFSPCIAEQYADCRMRCFISDYIIAYRITSKRAFNKLAVGQREIL